MDKALIEQFKTWGVRLGSRIGWGTGVGGISQYDWNIGFDQAPVVGNAEVTFKTHKHGDNYFVKFSNIRPTRIKKQLFHEPLTLDTQISSVNTSKISNTSENIDIDRGYEFEQSSETTYENQVGVEVGLMLRQNISYGGAASPVAGETEITATINTNFSHTAGGSSSNGTTIRNDITVPPKTEVTLTTQTSKSRFEQKCEFWCGIEASVSVLSYGDYLLEWSSMEDCIKTLRGNGPYSNDAFMQRLNEGWIGIDAANEIEEVNIPDQHFTTLAKFSNSTNGDIKITERAL
uniref:Uncharacterized protein n=1 Tax=Nitrosopumivirus cobalaminus TaxID=3158414 RepID=A0AAU7N480_9VIRU